MLVEEVIKYFKKTIKILWEKYNKFEWKVLEIKKIIFDFIEQNSEKASRSI